MFKKMIAFMAVAAMLTLGAGNVMAGNWKVVGPTDHNIAVGPLPGDFGHNGRAVAGIPQGDVSTAGNGQLNSWDRNAAVGALPDDMTRSFHNGTAVDRFISFNSLVGPVTEEDWALMRGNGMTGTAF